MKRGDDERVCALCGQGGWMAGKTKRARERERDGVTRVRDHGIWRGVGRAAVVGRLCVLKCCLANI